MNMTQAETMRRKRQHLARSKRNRQLTVAQFIRRTQSLANDLHDALTMGGRRLIEGLEQPPTGVQETIDFMEDQIREIYREEFGTEMGAMP